MHRQKGLRLLIALLVGAALVVSALVPAFAGSGSDAGKTPALSQLIVPADSDLHPVLSDAELLQELERRTSFGQNIQSLPAPMDAAPLSGVTLPIGQDTYKIEVNADGIYEITYSDLQSAGMAVDSVDPSTFQIIYRGDNVAYEFIGDADSAFESGESVRFFGKKFDGSRLERQYIVNNVYWLWADGSPTPIGTTTNPTGLTLDTDWLSSETYEIDFYQWATWTNQWSLFPNEPDAWFIQRLYKTTQPLITGTYQVNLPYPVASGPDAAFTVEVHSQEHPYIAGVPYPHVLRVHINDAATPDTTLQWYGNQNINAEGTVPLASLVNGSNKVEVVVATTTNSTNIGDDKIYVNRVTFDYQRQFIASGDQLIFSDELGGSKEFQVSGFSVGTPDQVFVWNVTDPLNPVMIPIAAGDIVDNSGVYTYRIGSTHGAGAEFVATNSSNLLSPVALSRYTPTDLDPVGGADWLAISYADFITQANALAAHRAQPLYGGFATHVVDVADIINQYGYGLPIPGAIRSFLAHGLTWSPAVQYVTLVGDATINPRGLTSNNPPAYDVHGFAYVPTDLAFVDRFQGQIPSDTSMSLLTGGDYIPDVKIGRLAVDSAVQAQNMVDKIIQYEVNQADPTDWSNNVLFAADNADSGGNFCTENIATGAYLPAGIDQTHKCMTTSLDTTKLKPGIFDHINITGSVILNYRGHGGIGDWANNVVTINDAGLWSNTDRPFIILSADCLDSHFAYSGWLSLAEVFMRLNSNGSAAHWSSTGLGLSYEHSELHHGFYQGMYDHNLTRIGDAIQYSKEQYEAGPYDISELLAFTLHGDPAMQVMRPNFVLDKEVVEPAVVAPGGNITFTLTLSNHGGLPSSVVLTDTLPANTSYVSHSSSAPVGFNQNGNLLGFSPTSDMVYSDTLVVTLTVQVASTDTLPLFNTGTAYEGKGLEAAPTDNTDSAQICTADLASAPAVSISRSGSDLDLTWGAVPLATGGYEVWQSPANDPYFTPGSEGTLLGTVAGTSYTVPGAISSVGNVTDNYTFALRSLNCTGTASAPSTQVGEFDFDIVAGLSASSFRYSAVSIPFTGTGVLRADDLAAYIDPGGSIKRVARWNADTETWVVRTVGAPFGTVNFPVSPGQPLLVGATDLAPDYFTWVGELATPGDIQFDLTASSYNYLSIPLDQNGAFVLMADSLAADIGGVTRVAKWNNGTQTWTVRNVGAPFGTANYAVFLGYPYLVLTGAAVAPWP